MSAQHTPGPWLAEGGKVFAETGRFFDRPVSVVGVPLDKSDSRFGELEANARLIAAAPDLLEALERLSAQCNRMRMPGQSMSDAEKNARAAIAKATGQKGGDA